MIVTVFLFAVAAEVVGERQLRMELPEDATVGELKAVLIQRAADLEPVLARCSISVNEAYSDDSAVLKDGDEIGLIPPVSGG